MQLSRWLLLGFVLLSVNCSWPKVADNKQTATDLTQTMATANQELGNLDQEYASAQGIHRKLEAIQPGKWSQQRGQSQQLLSGLGEEMKVLKRRNDELRVQAADFAAFAHSHQKIYERDPQWKQSVDWQNTIQSAVINFNRQLADTSRSLQTLFQFWTENRFYQRHDTTEVAVKWSAQVVDWKDQFERLKVKFSEGQVRFNRQPASLKTATGLSPLSDLNHDLNDMAHSLNQLESLRQEYSEKFGRRDEISNLDDEWTGWMEIQRRQAKIVGQLDALSARAKLAYDRLLKVEAKAKESEDQTQSPQ